MQKSLDIEFEKEVLKYAKDFEDEVFGELGEWVK